MPERGQPKPTPSKEAEEMAQVEADSESSEKYENLAELDEELEKGQKLLKELANKYDEFPEPDFTEETAGPLGEQHAKTLLNRDQIDDNLDVLTEEEQNEIHEYFRATSELESLEEGSESIGKGESKLKDAQEKAQEQQSDTIT